MLPLSSGWYSIPNTSQLTFALIAKHLPTSYTSFFNMVRIKLQVSVALVLAAAAIAPVVALPVTPNNGSVLY